MFGRKGLSSPQPAPAPVGEPLLDTGNNSIEFAKVAGEFFFQTLYQKIASGAGGDAISPHLVLGLIAAAGGVASIDTALRKFEYLKHQSDNPNLILEQEVDGKLYYVGDLPNHYLLENNHSVLCLALNAALDMGANVNLEFPHDAMRNVMNSVGTPAFGVPRLPEDHTPPALPLVLAGVAWPQAVHAFDLVGLAPGQRPAAMGYALQKAIFAIDVALDPMIMARIVVEYAVPMAAVDPSQFPPVTD